MLCLGFPLPPGHAGTEELIHLGVCFSQRTSPEAMNCNQSRVSEGNHERGGEKKKRKVVNFRVLQPLHILFTTQKLQG